MSMLKIVLRAGTGSENTILTNGVFLLPSSCFRPAGRPFCGRLYLFSKEDCALKNKPVSTPPKPRKRINHGRLLYTGFLTVCMLACFSQQAFAATTVWQKAEEIMKSSLEKNYISMRNQRLSVHWVRHCMGLRRSYKPENNFTTTIVIRFIFQ